MSQPPTPIRSRWLAPVISGVVGAVCLLVVVLAYAAFVGTLTARKTVAATRATAGAPLTAVPGSFGFPAVTLTGRPCGVSSQGAHGRYAAGNDATSCEFASNIQINYVSLEKARNGQPPATVTAYNARSGQGVTLTCTGTQPVTCSGPDNLIVYIYGGEATFTS